MQKKYFLEKGEGGRLYAVAIEFSHMIPIDLSRPVVKNMNLLLIFSNALM